MGIRSSGAYLGGRSGIYPVGGGNNTDPIADAFIAAHNTATGSSMDAVQQAAVQGLAERLRGTGTTNSTDFITASLIHALWPYCPTDDSTATSAGYALDLFLNYTLSFTGFIAGNFTPNGLTGGAGKYADTNFSTSLIDVNDNGFMYSYNAIGAAAEAPMGVYTGGLYFLAGLEGYGQYLGNITAVNPSNTSPYKNIIGTRRGITDVETYGDGASVATNTATTTAKIADYTYFLHARSNTGSQIFNSTGTFTSFGITKGLTDNQAADLSELINWYNANVVTGGRD
jgi:hypothetical protein